MIAAIYARKSTEQTTVADDQKSVARQIENARSFAESKGWTVDADSVFVDDAVSGAVFDDERPGLMRLLNALKPKAAFQVLVVMELDRLGRDQKHTPFVIQTIKAAGVDIWTYLNGGQCLQLDSPTDVLMMQIRAFAATQEREMARQRTKDALIRKARAGHVTGGRVFGYDNVIITTPDGKRSHVERRINDAEASVVRRIYELASIGHGLKQIAHALNDENRPRPKSQRGRPNGWAPASVREVLIRPIYRGVIEYDRVRRDASRKQHKSRANAEPIRIAAEHLRIVPEELAASVDAQRADRCERYRRAADGKLRGKGAPRVIKNLLAGVAFCECGATMEHVRGYYVCSARRRKGRTVCDSDVHLPRESFEHEILDRVERDVMDLDVLTPALDAAVERLASDSVDRSGHQAERARLDQEIANLANAVALGGDVQVLVSEIKRREARKAELDRTLNRPSIDREGLERALEAKLVEWKALLRSRPTHGQTVLRALIDGGRIEVASRAHAGSVRWCAAGSVSGLLAGVVPTRRIPLGTPHKSL